MKLLRVCRVCGLEAWKEEDLENFKKDKGCPHGRVNICKPCSNQLNRTYFPRPKTVFPYLRKCRICGVEAHNEEELNAFMRGKNSLYGRDNLCRECSNKLSRKGGKYFERVKLWRKNNPEIIKAQRKKSRVNRVLILGKGVCFKENPRTNVCSICGRRYPEELKRQTSIHHYKYDPENLLAHTVELCTSCHAKDHMRMGRKAVKICLSMGIDLSPT